MLLFLSRSDDEYNIIYMDDLVALLRKAGVGCHVLSSFVGAIMFADDLALLAPSRGAIQQLISICETYCNEYCLFFNASKTKAMLFGSHFDKLTPSPLILNDICLLNMFSSESTSAVLFVLVKV